MSARAPLWVPIEAAIDIHYEQLAEHGGAHGIRDPGMLEAALSRSQQLFSYGTPTPSIFELAAAYTWSLCRNHPFIDGNKRIAFLTCVMFLRMNGYHLDAPESEAVEAIISAAGRTWSEADLGRWVERRSVPVRNQE